MKTQIVLVFVVVAIAAAYAVGYGGYDRQDGYGYSGRYGYGFRRTPYGIEAAYNNAARQEKVNHIAEYVGASSGTARYYGVPGTGRYFDRHYYGDRHGYGY